MGPPSSSLAPCSSCPKPSAVKLSDILFDPPLAEQLPKAARGTFGVVVFGVWRAHNTPVAVKLIAARSPTGAASISIMSWLSEAELMRRLREHRSPATGLTPQHVVNLFGIGAVEERGEVQQYLVVMERLEGSLRDVLDKYLAKGRQPPLAQALQW